MAQQHVVPRFLLPSSQFHSQPDAGWEPLPAGFAYLRYSRKPPGILILKINIQPYSQSCQRIRSFIFRLMSCIINKNIVIS